MSDSSFEIIGFVPPQLAGIDAKLIRDLLDIVETYGISEYGGQFVRVPGQPIVVVLVSNDLGKVLQVICPVPTQEMSATLIRTEAVLVMWDLRVTIETAREFIAVVHELRDLQLIWSPRVERPPRRILYEVDNVFRRRGAVVPVETDRLPPDMLVALFDRPEVALIRTTEGKFAFCRLSDVGYLLRRNEMVAEVLRRFRVNDLSHLDADRRALALSQIDAWLLAEFGPDA